MMRFNPSLEAFGLIIDADFPRYFCTPENATIFASTGCDGIHFCFLNTEGKAEDCPIYVVSPMMLEPYVFMVAPDYRHFLGLLFVCKDASLIEAISYLDAPDFEEALATVSTDLESDRERYDALIMSMTSLANEWKIPTIDKPYSFVRSLQHDHPFRYEMR